MSRAPTPQPALGRAPTPQPYESFPSISIEYGQSMPSMPAVSRTMSPQSGPPAVSRTMSPQSRPQTPAPTMGGGKRVLVIGFVAAVVIAAGIAIAMYV